MAALVVGSSMSVSVGWLCLRAGNETTTVLSTPVRPREIVNSFLHGFPMHATLIGRRYFFETDMCSLRVWKSIRLRAELQEFRYKTKDLIYRRRRIFRPVVKVMRDVPGMV